MPDAIEPDLLQTFVAIAETGSFTGASRRVHRTQSAVSMQIKRLEELLDRPLFVREGRSVGLTSDGELLLGHARRILAVHREAMAAFAPCALSGTVSFGARDEDAVTFLPGILARFAESHPNVHINFVSDRSPVLLERLEAGEIDFALVTHSAGDGRGRVILREPLVWVASARHCAHLERPVPLALFHGGCQFRQWAIEALARADLAYRLAYTSVSLSGIEAALRVGLGVSVLQRSNVTPGLKILDGRDGFPPLPECEVALHRADRATSPLHDRLEAHILENVQPQARASAAA